jgi:vacuolar-type H+-ATPase subunit F/Vma7
MSRLIVLTRPELVPGFQLAGVDAYGAEDVETAQEQIEAWWIAGEAGLLAIDDGLLEKMDPVFVKRMDTFENILYVAIPAGAPLGTEASRRFRIAEMIRRAIGFQITFKGEAEEVEQS